MTDQEKIELLEALNRVENAVLLLLNKIESLIDVVEE